MHLTNYGLVEQLLSGSFVDVAGGSGR